MFFHYILTMCLMILDFDTKILVQDYWDCGAMNSVQWKRVFIGNLQKQVDFFWTGSSLRVAFLTLHPISLIFQSHPVQVQHPSHISIYIE